MTKKNSAELYAKNGDSLKDAERAVNLFLASIRIYL